MFRNIHRKTPVLESLFIEIASLQVFSCEYCEYLRIAASALLIIKLIGIEYLPTFSTHYKKRPFQRVPDVFLTL